MQRPYLHHGIPTLGDLPTMDLLKSLTIHCSYEQLAIEQCRGFNLNQELDRIYSFVPKLFLKADASVARMYGRLAGGAKVVQRSVH